MYEIVIGRDAEDKKRYGDKGLILLGKHYVKMGQTTSLSNNIYMDIARSHVLFVCGKRGSGKSYTMGDIAEAMMELPKEINENLSVIMLDTMGIYWTMKYENKQEADLLKDWGLQSKALNVRIYTPAGYYEQYKEKGIPTDAPFSIKPAELTAIDWAMTFNVSITDEVGVIIGSSIATIKETNSNYSIDDIITQIKNDKKSDPSKIAAAVNLFLSAKGWGLFDKKGVDFRELAAPGQITILDVSPYISVHGAESIRALVIGLVCQKLFFHRMIMRKNEEYLAVHRSLDYIGSAPKEDQSKLPIIWIMIDEAHEFLPKKGETAATGALLTLLREGRQPGISLVLASQQPGQIHTDVMTQSDIVIAHRITAKIDIDALGLLMQSYMREGLDKAIDNLPRVKGAAIIFDDTNERMYPARIRPRITWHGGSSPSPIKAKQNLFESTLDNL